MEFQAGDYFASVLQNRESRDESSMAWLLKM